MSELTRTQISDRLARLAADLEAFPAGAPCPWALGKVFNELVKLVKRDLDQDPVMRTMRLLDDAEVEAGPPTTNAAVGTVRALIGQVMVAYEHATAAKPSQAAPRGARKRVSAAQKVT